MEKINYNKETKSFSKIDYWIRPFGIGVSKKQNDLINWLLNGIYVEGLNLNIPKKFHAYSVSVDRSKGVDILDEDKAAIEINKIPEGYYGLIIVFERNGDKIALFLDTSKAPKGVKDIISQDEKYEETYNVSLHSLNSNFDPEKYKSLIFNKFKNKIDCIASIQSKIH